MQASTWTAVDSGRSTVESGQAAGVHRRSSGLGSWRSGGPRERTMCPEERWPHQTVAGAAASAHGVVGWCGDSVDGAAAALRSGWHGRRSGGRHVERERDGRGMVRHVGGGPGHGRRRCV
jgi:hypothetical protein